MLKSSYDYELALSFSTEDNEIVDKFYFRFKEILGDSVFKSDKIPETFCASDDIHKALQNFFGFSARSIIIFQSKNYEKSVFTNTELETILSRFSNDNDFLYFIVKLDDTDFIQVKNPNKIYIKYDGSNFDSIIDTIKRKMIKHNMQQQLSDDYIDIAIKSKGIPDEVKWQENYNWSIMLKNFFEGNYLTKLRDVYSWNDVTNYFEAEYSFIKSLLNNSKKVRFLLNCHFTFAFLAGKLTSEIGRFNKNIILKKPDGTDLNLYDDSSTGEYEDFSYELSGKSSEESENILIVSIRRDIKTDVERHISNNPINKGLVLHAKIDGNIEDGIHATRLILSLKQYIETNRISKSGKMHVFYNGPAFFIFMFGNYSQFMGKMMIYEYLPVGNTYYPSLER